MTRPTNRSVRDAGRALLLAAGATGMLLAVACGGKAVVDGEAGLGGAGGATTLTGTGATTTTWTTGPTTTMTFPTTTTTGVAGAGGAAPSCDDLLAELERAVDEAMVCNPWVNAIQCTAAGVVFDACGCALAGNETNMLAVMAARDVYAEFVAWGCGPWDCTYCPPSPEYSPWYCHPDLGRCEAADED